MYLTIWVDLERDIDRGFKLTKENRKCLWFAYFLCEMAQKSPHNNSDKVWVEDEEKLGWTTAIVTNSTIQFGTVRGSMIGREARILVRIEENGKVPQFIHKILK